MSAPEATTITHANVTDASGNINVLLTWPPPYDGGYAITRYRILYGLINDDTSYLTKELVLADSPGATNPGTGLISYTLTQLIKGGIYQIQISAINGFGSGPYSNNVRAYPGTTPSKLNVAASEIYAARGSTQVTLFWIQPYDGGYPIISYSVRFRSVSLNPITQLTPWSDPPIELSAITQAATITDLLNGTYYQFQVAARNDVELAEYNDPILVKPGDIPGDFSGNISTDFLESGIAHNNGRIFLEWSPPAYNGGYDLENFLIQYKSATDVYFTTRVLPLTQRQLLTPAFVSQDYSCNIIVDYTGDASSNPPIPIVRPLANDVRYSVRIGVQNDVGIRWLPNRVGLVDNYATVIPGTFAKPVLNLSATIADGTAKLGWTWDPVLLNNGYPFANYYVVRYRQYNDLYWHELIYPYESEKLDYTNTVNNYTITLAETGPVAINRAIFTNAVRDTSTNVYDYLDPTQPPFQARQPIENGIPYDFQVAAVNHIPRGPDTGIAVGAYAQTRQTPGRVPDALAKVQIQRELQRATLTWLIPQSDGGYPVLSYRIRVRPVSCFTQTMSPSPSPSSASPLPSSTIATVLASYNRQGIGITARNVVLQNAAILGRYTDASANAWNTVEYSATAQQTQLQLPFSLFTTDVLFDVSISATNQLGNGAVLFLTDKYSTKAYKPDAPLKLVAQLLKSATLNGGSGAVFINWTTPVYYGGTLAIRYAYEIQYSMLATTPLAGDDSVWFGVNLNPQTFGEYQAPATTKTPGTVITALYSIYSSANGIIGDSFMQWIRVRSTARSSASGSAANSDGPSDWTVCGVNIIP
jgi:hypothetical protein